MGSIDTYQQKLERECAENGGCQDKPVMMTDRKPGRWSVRYKCEHCYSEREQTFNQVEPPHTITDSGNIIV